MFDNIRADIGRKRMAYGVRPQDQAFFNKHVVPYLEMGTFAIAVYRYGQWCFGIKIPVVRQLLILSYFAVNILSQIITGIHLQRESKIGPGLIIHNFSCIFVLADRIGHSCTLNQGVTIGSVRGTGRPVIGDNVYIGAGAKVMGGIKIGNNVVIAANSLVVADIEDNCTVVGVPARVISREATSPYLKFAIK